MTGNMANRLTRVLLLFFLGVYCIPAAAADIPQAHSLTTRYQYEKSGRTIYMGTQPLAAPIGVVQAVMQRDMILERALLLRGQHLKCYPFYKGPDINAVMQRGDIDISMAGDAPVLSSVAMSDSDIVILALAKQGSSSLVSKKTMVSLRALKGKRIGYPAGSTAELGLLITLSTIGLDERSITLVPMEVSVMSTAVMNGQIDAFAAFEPTSVLALAANPELKVYAKFLNTSYLYANRSFVEQNPYAAEHILAAYVRAVRWLRASDRNLSRAIEWSIRDADAFLGRPSGMKANILKEIMLSDLLRFGDPVLPSQVGADQGHLGKIFQFLQARGRIDRGVLWAKVKASINNDLMKKILSSPKQFKLDSFSYSMR